MGGILSGGVLPRSMTQGVTFIGMKSVGMKFGEMKFGGVLPRSMTQGVTFKGMKSVGMKSGWDEICRDEIWRCVSKVNDTRCHIQWDEICRDEIWMG